MKFYLVRHGAALPEGEDAARRLSPRGREAVRALGQFLQRSGAVQAERILHSPLARARETAELLGEALGLPLQESNGLRPEDSPFATAERLERSEASLMLVGHDPHLSSLAALLVSGGGATGGVEMKKGTAACLERFRGDVWELKWLMPPGLLKQEWE
jgi:phosphohistidine phosphatase